MLEDFHQFDLEGDVLARQGVVGVKIDFLVAHFDHQNCQFFIVLINQHDFVTDLGLQVLWEGRCGEWKKPFLHRTHRRRRLPG